MPKKKGKKQKQKRGNGKEISVPPGISSSIPTNEQKKEEKQQHMAERSGNEISGPPDPQRERCEDQEATTTQHHITYNISSWNNCHIGDKSQTNIIYEARRMFNDSQGSSPKKRDEVIIGMLNSILNPSCADEPGQMNLQKLETAFNKLYGSIIEGKQQTFKYIMGKPLKKFVSEHNSCFQLETVKEQYIVKQIREIKHSGGIFPGMNMLSDCFMDSPMDQEQNKLPSDVFGDPAAGGAYPDSSTCAPALTAEPLTEPTSPELPQSAGHEKGWSEVRRKKTQRKTPEPDLQAKIENLLKTLPGPDLILQQSEERYFNNRELFSLDVVSMWNTPSISGHILLGVKPSKKLPHEVTGLSQRKTTEEVKDLFLSDYFSKRPSFNYQETHVKGRLIGLITMHSSAGQGSPIKTAKEMSSVPRVKPEQLWYRQGGSNVECNTGDGSTKNSIYNWFIGSKHRSETTKQLQETKRILYAEKVSALPAKPDRQCSSLDSFSKGHFVLVVGQITSNTPHLESLMQIPWLYVFDFDLNSRENGTYAACDSVLGKTRSKYISHWGRTPPGIADCTTTWCFVRGVKDIPESRAEGKFREWMRQTKDGLVKHCQQLAKFAADYTTLRVLVVWPDLDFCPNHLLRFLQLLDETLEVKIEIHFSLAPKTTDGKNLTQNLSSLLEIKVREQCPVEKLCQEINNCFHYKNKGTMLMKLPACGVDGSDIEIPKQDQMWLSEDLDVLYLESPYSKSCDTEEVSEDIENFFKGGTMHWFTWYECGAGHNDVQRDEMIAFLRDLEDLLKTPRKPTVVTLLHAPGAGGTTYAQRLLWELHIKTPCVQVRTGAGSTLEQIGKKIEHLYKISGSTIILLLDGEEETRVKLLSSQLSRISAIILYVKRYPYAFKTARRGELKYYLNGEVTKNEAKRLTLKLKDRIHDTQRQTALDDLTKSVFHGETHCLYEFGLTAYQHEFRGITSYVKGYLKLNQNPGRNLLEWQKVLGYLALAHYYGQASVPCQFFGCLLGKPPNYDISVDDFPQNAREFIKEDTTKPKHIRTSHYIISQEILEQVLTRHKPGGDQKDRTDLTSLSKLAKKNLKDFAESFIEYASSKKTKQGLISNTITYILTKTFILREYRDTTEGPYEAHRRKPNMSKLLSDIDSSAPFTERLSIHEKLCQSFPMDPNFHAHLGRFYTYWRPDEVEKAEKCFQTALDICDKLEKNDDDDKLKQTLTQVYHMYGMIYLRRVKSMKADMASSDEERLDSSKVNEIFEQTKRACDLFSKCRQTAPIGQEHNHGYVGEISARLELCGAIENYFGEVQAFIKSHSKNQEMVQFLTDCISVIDNLILECYHYVGQEDLGRAFYDVVCLFNSTFSKDPTGLEKLCLPEDSASRRLQIAAKKMKYVTNPRMILSLENVSEEDITDIIHMYESNFKEVQETGYIADRKALEMDYKEWIVGIRHRLFQKTYSLEDVQTQVNTWCDNLRTPFSHFYLFVLTSLMGFESKSKSAKKFYLQRASELKEEFRRQSKYMPQPRHPREWLGKGEGIGQLVAGTRSFHGHIDTVKRNMKAPMESKLTVCKGTICAGNKKLSGLIDLDLGDTPITVKVFYVPKVCNLEGKRFEGERVEFLLAFTLDKGYEAFNVRRLTKTPCRVCKTSIEVKSDETEVKCPACERMCFLEGFGPFEHQ